jgi:hypothetical protein
MPASPLVPSNRYFVAGTRQITWVPVMSNYLAPTRAELNSGTDITGQISAVNGFSVTANMVDAPDMASKFVPQISGRLTAGQSDLTCYLSNNSIDARSLLPRGATGNVVIFWEGDQPGLKMSVFPTTVVSQAPDTATDNPGTAVFSFAPSRVPAENLTVPA